MCSTGPQPDALEGLTVPPNAVCRSYIPQVDLLSSGAVGMFVTHGGQNSFTESMANGVPLVVVPGFGDQPVNGRKAERLGLGVAVPRPQEDSAAVIEEYVRDLRQAMRGHAARGRVVCRKGTGDGGGDQGRRGSGESGGDRGWARIGGVTFARPERCAVFVCLCALNFLLP